MEVNSGIRKSVEHQIAPRLTRGEIMDSRTITVEGAVAKPQVFDLDDLLKLAPMEERIYRMRCVEAWSMVIPWRGVPLADLHFWSDRLRSVLQRYDEALLRQPLPSRERVS